MRYWKIKLALVRHQTAIMLLLVLLHRSPFFRYISHFNKSLSQPLVRLVQNVSIAVASLGAVQAVSGATRFSTQPSGPFETRAEENFSMSFTVVGSPANPASWLIEGNVPPGLNVTSNSGNTLSQNSLNGRVVILSGSPTSPGAYSFTAQAYKEENLQGDTDGIKNPITITVIQALPPVPEILSHPSSLSVRPGAVAIFSVQGNDTPSTLQWFKNNIPIPGENSESLIMENVDAAAIGTYVASISNESGTVLSDPATLSLNAIGSSSLVNIANRGFVGTGDDVMIVGLTIAGSGSKRILLRASGPALANANPPVSGALADPTMLVVGSGGFEPLSNDNWSEDANTAEIESTSAAVGVESFAPGSKDAAILADFPAGTYGAILSGADGATGVALVEAFDADTGAPIRLTNLSTRCVAGDGDNVVIPGFVIQGNVAKTVIIRGIGPNLIGQSGGPTADQVLQNPNMTLFQTFPVFRQVTFNEDWEDSGNTDTISNLFQQVGASVLPEGSVDSAIVATLAPGGYGVVTSGSGSDSGICLVEVFEVD